MPGRVIDTLLEPALMLFEADFMLGIHVAANIGVVPPTQDQLQIVTPHVTNRLIDHSANGLSSKSATKSTPRPSVICAAMELIHSRACSLSRVESCTGSCAPRSLTSPTNCAAWPLCSAFATGH